MVSSESETFSMVAGSVKVDKEMIEHYLVRAKESTPLSNYTPTPLSDYPWQTVALYLSYLNADNYYTSQQMATSRDI